MSRIYVRSLSALALALRFCTFAGLAVTITTVPACSSGDTGGDRHDDDDDDDTTSASSGGLNGATSGATNGATSGATTGDPNPQTSAGPSSTSGDPSSCTGDDMSCANSSTLEACENGHLVSYPCGDVCGEVGFDSNGCSSDTCQCGAPLNAQCADGTGAFCFCAEYVGAQSCSDDDMTNLYVGCFQGDPDMAPMLKCFEGYLQGNTIDCSAAINGCL